MLLFLVMTAAALGSETPSALSIGSVESYLETLFETPAGVRLTTAVKVAESELSTEQAAFDWQWSTLVQATDTLTGTRTNYESSNPLDADQYYDLVAETQIYKRFGQGTLAIVGLETRWSQIEGNDFVDDERRTTSGYNPSLVLSLRHSLLKGGGWLEASLAQETSRIDLERERQTFELGKESLAFLGLSLLAEFDFYAERVKLFRENYQRVEQMLKEGRTLVERGEWAPAELSIIEANLAKRRLEVVREERSLSSIHSFIATLLHADVSNFKLEPEVLEFYSKLGDFGSHEKLSALARATRHDYRAAKSLLAKRRLEYQAAQSAYGPTLDVVASIRVSSGGVDSDSLGLRENLNSRLSTGRSGNIGVQLSVPFGFREELADLDKAKAELTDSEFELATLEREIDNSIKTLIEQFEQAARIRDEAREHEAAYQIARDSEAKKLRAGLSTVIDLISLESSLSLASEERLSAEKNFRDTWLNFRRSLGCLVGDDAQLIRPDLKLGVGEGQGDICGEQ